MPDDLIPRNLRIGQQALSAFADVLAKTFLTCVPEPHRDVHDQAVARGKIRYDRSLKSLITLRDKGVGEVRSQPSHRRRRITQPVTPEGHRPGHWASIFVVRGNVENKRLDLVSQARMATWRRRMEQPVTEGHPDIVGRAIVPRVPPGTAFSRLDPLDSGGGLLGTAKIGQCHIVFPRVKFLRKSSGAGPLACAGRPRPAPSVAVDAGA